MCGGSTTGYEGVWRAINCAQWWEAGPFDCAPGGWGDGTLLMMVVGNGDTPRVVDMSAYSPYCKENVKAPRWIGLGMGEYEGGTLWVNFGTTHCGPLTFDGFTLAFWHDPGSDTLWSHEDQNGYGIHWWRVGG